MTYRWLRHGEDIPKGQPRRTMASNGYVLLSWQVDRCSVARVYEHQLVARLPPSGLIVHHKNGVKTDNRIDNLELLPRPDHGRHHKPCKFDVQYAARLYEAGSSTVAIAKELGTFAGNVSRALRNYGVAMRPPGVWSARKATP